MTEFTLIPKSGAVLPAAPFQARHLIGGRWQDSADGAVSERLSPSHGVVVSRAAKGGKAEAEAAIAAARTAFDDGRWSRLSGKARAAVLLKTADLIEANVERMALLETLESGKPISQSRGEVGGAADLWRYAASLARTLHGDSHNSLGEDMLAVVLKEPIGVVSVITPWNFPFWILSQKLPFALAAGCTCVVKPSELTPSTTVMLGELLIEAGLPAGVVNIVLGYGQPVGATLASDPRVDMVTFTGSTAVGRGIAAAASATLKKVALELGGKNPQVIFPDADLESAADAVVFGVYFNVGQCCNSGSRIIVHEDIAEAFTARVVELSKQVAFGDPLDPATQVGAIVTPEHGAKIDGYVAAAREGRGQGCAWRWPPAGARPRTAVLPANRGDRCHPGHGNRPGRGLWAGADRPDLPHAGRGAKPCERRGLRPFCWGLEREYPHLPGLCPGCSGRHGLDQHLDGRLPGGHLRRRQAIGPWPRDRTLWPG
jgi:betaine-aldehyde dehydrogenase